MSDIEMALKQEGVLEQCYAACARLNLTLGSYLAKVVRDSLASEKAQEVPKRMTVEEIVERGSTGDPEALAELDAARKTMMRADANWDDGIEEARYYD